MSLHCFPYIAVLTLMSLHCCPYIADLTMLSLQCCPYIAVRWLLPRCPNQAGYSSFLNLPGWPIFIIIFIIIVVTGNEHSSCPTFNSYSPPLGDRGCVVV